MMRQDRFTLTPALSLVREREQRSDSCSVILSGDHARTEDQRWLRRNLGWGEPPVSQQRSAAGDLKVAPTSDGKIGKTDA